MYRLRNIFYYLRLSFTALLLAFFAFHADAQVKIGTNGNIIAPASILELESTNQGLLLPRLADTAAINALNPPNGMLIYLTKAPAVGLYVRKVTGGVGFWEWLSSASTTVNVSDDNATVTRVYPTFVTGTNGAFGPRTSTSRLFYVPSSGVLTASSFTSTIPTGTPPFIVGSSSPVLNLSATNSTNVNITDDVATNVSTYPTFVTGTTGNLGERTSSSRLTFVPSTGILTATGFNGSLVGNFTSTVVTGTPPFTVASTTTVPNLSSTNSTNVNITDDVATNISTYPTFVTGTAGNLGERTASSRLTFVPSTGILTATGFNGSLVGNFTSTVVTGTPPFTVASTTTVPNLSSTNSTNVNITDDVATAVTTYPTFVTGTAGNLGERTSSSRLTFVPSTGVLSSTSFTGAGTGLTGTAASLNAGTATALQTARNINGVAFDGTANITVTAAAGTLTGNTLNNSVLFSSLTSVGTLTNGTWNAGTVTTTKLSGKTPTTPPTTIAGAGAGTGPTINVTGTDVAGLISITVGSAVPAGASVVVTVNYVNGNYTTGSFPVLFPSNGNAASVAAQISAIGNNGSFTITTNNALVTGNNYSWNYHVIGY
jgi:uncharacterized membrane protein